MLWASASGSSATSATKPKLWARAASIRRPKSAISLITGSGISLARRCVPDQPGTMPTCASGRANVAPGTMTRISQAAASSSPPPKAGAWITAMVGLDNRASRSKMRCPSRTQSRAKSKGESSAQAVISAPAQKARSPSDRTITHSTSPARSSVAQCPSNCASISGVKAFSLAGLSSTICAIGPSICRCTALMAPTPSADRARGSAA